MGGAAAGPPGPAGLGPWETGGSEAPETPLNCPRCGSCGSAAVEGNRLTLPRCTGRLVLWHRPGKGVSCLQPPWVCPGASDCRAEGKLSPVSTETQVAMGTALFSSRDAASSRASCVAGRLLPAARKSLCPPQQGPGRGSCPSAPGGCPGGCPCGPSGRQLALRA